jgi:hypothetical protein
MCKKAHNKNFVAKVKEKKMANSDSLHLKNAYDFLKEHGYENVVSKIKKSSDTYKNQADSAKRAKIVALLEIVDLLYDSDCIKKCWPYSEDNDRSRAKLDEYRIRFFEMMEQKQAENQ